MKKIEILKLTQNQFELKPWFTSIYGRTAMLSWLLIIGTLIVYVSILIPSQKREAADRMKSEANGIAASIGQVTANSIILEDYSFAVEQCLKVISESKSVQYIVISRHDGFSLVHTGHQWHLDTLSVFWTSPDKSLRDGKSVQTELSGQKVFHYAYSLNYSGIDWGWIHIGLSLKKYHAFMRSTYIRTFFTALLCILVGLGAALIFAQRLSLPIRELDRIARRVAAGEKNIRAGIRTGDELESLAASFNQMTDALHRIQDELELRVQERTNELARSNQALQLEIVERRKAEDQVWQLNEELEKRVTERTAQLEATTQELEGFVYSVSHDLRAPIRHITGFVDLLKSKLNVNLDATSQKYLNNLTHSTLKLSKLIDDLLVFSRIGRAEMRKFEIDLNKVVHEILHELKPDLQGRNIFWRVSKLEPVHCDPTLMRQVMMNFIANAVKFTRPRDQAMVEIGNLDSNDNETTVFIRDNGVGFDMKYIDKLFGVFQRLHHASEFEGTGIGLANVKRIIHIHGGRVWAEAKLDQGATFYFTLPKQTQVRIGEPKPEILKVES